MSVPSFSSLAWEVAKRCRYEQADDGVRATVTVSSATEVFGIGPTTNTATQDLAVNLDKWARCPDA